MPATSSKLDALLATHAAAVGEFLDRANGVGEGRWNLPRAEGKWSPAQEVKHVVLAYEAFTNDLRGAGQMKLVGTPIRRRIWRLIGLTMILRMKRLPKGARAPRESRPGEGTLDRASTLADFRSRTAEFESAFRAAWRDNPGKTVVHPYFGALSLVDSMQMCTVHTRHHAAVLPPPELHHPTGAVEATR